MKWASVLLAVCCCLPLSAASAAEPSFDSRDVVRQIRGSRLGQTAESREPLTLDEGEFLIDTSITLLPAPNDQIACAVAFDGVNFLVVWVDDRGSDNDIYGARVTPAGTVLDSTGIVVSQAPNNQYLSALAFDGANFLVVWTDCRSDPYGDIYGARVTPQGTVLDPSGLVISQAADDQWDPSVGFDGENFLVVWEDDRGSDYDIYGARVTPEGTVLDSAGIVISQAAGGQHWPSVGFDGANFLVVWGDYRSSNNPDIYGARVTPQGTVLDPSGIVISQAANNQSYPAVGLDGASFLVVWEDRRSDSLGDIHGARVTPAGTVLDPSGIVISQAANSQYFPAVGLDGADFLVVWDDHRSGSSCDVYGARVTTAGAVLDSSGFVISQAARDQSSPAVGFDGTNFLVVWTDSCGYQDFDIYGARVTPQGTVLDPSGIVVSQAADEQECPALAFDGANFLVVWTDDRCETYPDIYGARVTPAGTVLDPSGIVISQATYNQDSPAVGFDGANFLVVWEDSRNRSVSNCDIYGARVAPAGVVLDSAGIAISQAANDQCFPAVGFDGGSFLVAWEDFRGGSYSDIYGVRVTPAGALFDGGSVVNQQGHQRHPRLCCGDGSQMFLVYQGWTGTVGSKTCNIDRIWGKMNPNPGIEEIPGPQSSSHKLEATIVRGVLFVPEAPSPKPQATSWLLDAAGRKVTNLHPGANDVRALAPGV